ncbi:MAG: hypothetical protein AAF401_11370 [Pseudomonadota bacterium]
MNRLTITSVVCDETCATFEAYDNVFMPIQADGGLPIRYPPYGNQKMTDGDAMDLPDGGLKVDYEYGVVVTFWDEDSKIVQDLNQPDYLFNINVNAGSTSGSNTKYNLNGAKYTFHRDVAYNVEASNA